VWPWSVCSSVPQPDRTVLAARRQPLAAPRERDAVDPARVALERLERLQRRARRRVPQPDRAVARARRHESVPTKPSTRPPGEA
jgi:hypothetical protein